MKLPCDGSFRDRQDKGQIGYRPKVAHVDGVQARLLEQWNDHCMLLRIRQSSLIALQLCRREDSHKETF